MKSKKKAWSKSFGRYGNRIRLFQDPISRIMYCEYRDPEKADYRYKTRSLGHRSKQRAEQWAREEVAKLEAGDDSLHDPTPTLARVIGSYLTYHTPRKAPAEQEADRRRVELWTRVLGPKKDLSNLTLYEWNNFIDKRGSGVINARGEVPEGEGKPVRDGTVAADLTFLKSVINWACRWQDPATGRYLMKENPARGFELPTEKNPRRPVATQDRFEKVRAAAEKVEMVVGRGKARRSVRSYLPEILDIVNGTGRRISAVLALRYQDLRLDQGAYGAIHWPADTDKMGVEWLVPIAKRVRGAIDAILTDRPGIGAAYLFPAPKGPSKHLSNDTASVWLEQAEKIAGVPKQNGTLWHAYRRKWVTERKHLPDVDVAAAGGWSDTATLKLAYQQADEATMFRVVSEPAELRGVSS